MGKRTARLPPHRSKEEVEGEIHDSLKEKATKHRDIIMGMDSIEQLLLSVMLEHEKKAIALRANEEAGP